MTGAGQAGGLIGQNEAVITATYATGNVRVSTSASCQDALCRVAGGLIGLAKKFVQDQTAASRVTTSYSAGRVSGPSGYDLGGLVGAAERATSPGDSATFTVSYWDTQTSGPTFGVGSDDEDDSGLIDGAETLTTGVTGQTTTALREPTNYDGIFQAWDVTVPFARGGSPHWASGEATDYPALSPAGRSTCLPRRDGQAPGHGGTCGRRHDWLPADRKPADRVRR